MSRTISVTISERAFARHMADAVAAGTDIRTHLAAIVNADAAGKDDADSRRLVVQGRAADPRGTLTRRKRTRWDAVDAAIERTGAAVRRHNITAALMGDPEARR